MVVDVDAAEPISDLPMAGNRLIGASCSLSAADMRERLAEWRTLRDRATAADRIPGGMRLAFDAAVPIGPIADLVSRESECCAFYSFAIAVDGPMRELRISAGPGNEAAVQALLGLGS